MLGLLLLLTLLGTITINVSAQQEGPGGPGSGSPPEQRRSADGTVWVETDIITIMADSEIPQLHFWFAVDQQATHAKFQASYLMIVEFEDANEDGAYQTDEQLYFAPLAAYEWSLTTGSIEENGVTTEVWLKYTKSGVREGPTPLGAETAAINGPGSVMRFEDVTIQLWAHIYLNDYEGTVTDDKGANVSYLVEGQSEFKMDIEIGNFPFSSESTAVAIQTLLKEDVDSGDTERNRHRIQTRERFRNNSIDSSMNWTTTGGNETRFERMNGTSTQVMDFVDAGTSEPQGFFSWVDQALITLPGGEQELVFVNASYVPTGAGVAVYLSYPNFNGGSILHDPSIGLYPGAAPLVGIDPTVLLIGGIGGIVVLAITVGLVQRRRNP
jgi:hypothetical protein